ncbi:MAG TPA: hypothetical protein VFV27_08740 [Nevskiaceae bacterium]|nr:hypothetical protein [Nevskiaceae bacterium]
MDLYDRQYWREFTLWALVFAVIAVGGAWLAKPLSAEHPLRTLVVLPVALFAAAGFLIEWRQFRRFDEFQKSLYLEAMMAMGYTTMAFCMAAMMLVATRVIQAPDPAYTLVVMGLGFYIGLWRARRRYRE